MGFGIGLGHYFSLWCAPSALLVFGALRFWCGLRPVGLGHTRRTLNVIGHALGRTLVQWVFRYLGISYLE